MLINTVILFLRDALPIVIIGVLLLALKASSAQQSSSTWLLLGGVIGFVMMILFKANMGLIAQTLDNTGLEWLLAMLHVLIYCTIVNHLAVKSWRGVKWQSSWMAVAIFSLVLTLYGGNFLVYFTGYWSQAGVQRSLLVGVVLGLGICISIGILMYFALLFADQKVRWASTLVLLLYGAGQLMQSSSLLMQIDMFGQGDLLWDSNFFINESSELGHFLTALLGYDATPTLLQLLIYGVAVVIPMVMLKMMLNRRSIGNITKGVSA